MTLEDVQKQEVFHMRGIDAAIKEEPATLEYILECLARFFAGDYGDIPQEDTEANNSDLAAGEGHILAKYPARHSLTGDIYIESYFSGSNPGVDYNHIMIMYPAER